MFCPKCSAENPADAGFCASCGALLTAASPATDTDTMSPRPAAAPLRVEYAGFWRRVAAVIIDGLLLSIPNGFINMIFGMSMFPFMDSGSSAASGAMFVGMMWSSFFQMIATWLYGALMESSPYQATLGKMVMGARVTDTDGNRISFLRASGRFFGKYVSMAILFIGFIMVAFTEKKQGLHDMLADTLVVKK